MNKLFSKISVSISKKVDNFFKFIKQKKIREGLFVTVIGGLFVTVIGGRIVSFFDNPKTHTPIIKKTVQNKQTSPKEVKTKLTITTNPEKSIIEFQNKGQIYNNPIQLNPGKYPVLIKHDGFCSKKEIIEIKQNNTKPLTKHITLTPLFSNVKFQNYLREDTASFLQIKKEGSYNSQKDNKLTACLYDVKKKLIWQYRDHLDDDGTYKYYYQSDLKQQIKQLNKRCSCAVNNWRLPTSKEIIELYSQEKHNNLLTHFFDKNKHLFWVIDENKCVFFDNTDNGSIADCISPNELHNAIFVADVL